MMIATVIITIVTATITLTVRITVTIQKLKGSAALSLGSQADAAHGHLAASEGLVVPWQPRWVRECGFGFSA